jgi:hypothetical protein
MSKKPKKSRLGFNPLDAVMGTVPAAKETKQASAKNEESTTLGSAEKRSTKAEKPAAKRGRPPGATDAATRQGRAVLQAVKLQAPKTDAHPLLLKIPSDVFAAMENHLKKNVSHPKRAKTALIVTLLRDYLRREGELGS